jgi:hypothetical protein
MKKKRIRIKSVKLLINNKVMKTKQLDYKVFPSEEKTISVVDDDTYGGAHRYIARHSLGFNNNDAEYIGSYTEINFIKKNDDGSIIAGLQSEQLAYIMLDRVIKLNNRFPSKYNEKQIVGLKIFIEGCEDRIKDRLYRNVMGELKT